MGAPAVFSDRYELVRHIARGGMAQVSLAQDMLLDRPVAIKVLFPELSSDPSFVERFRREAQAAANLSHANIVSIYDWGQDEQTYYIVMEYIDGHTLCSLIDRGPLDPARAATIGADMAGALDFAHRRGVVHRDVKPGNVLIDQKGGVKVADFGIARAMNQASQNLTQTGAVMGTATYFSPEQAQGLPVDARSDVYSLGVVLYEMVTGKPPFSGDSAVAIAYEHVHEPPVPPSSVNPAVPPTFERIVMTAMAKDPDKRYQSAAKLREDLVRFCHGQPVLAPAPTPGDPVTRPVGGPAPPQHPAYDRTLLQGQDHAWAGAQGQALVQGQVPAQERTLVQGQVPAQERTLVHGQVPAQERTLVQGQVPAQERTLVQGQVPVPGQAGLQGRARVLGEVTAPFQVARVPDQRRPRSLGAWRARLVGALAVVVCPLLFVVGRDAGWWGTSALAPTITSASSANAEVGRPFLFTVTTKGRPTPHITEPGILPSGLRFTAGDANGTATISGTPAPGTGKAWSLLLGAVSSAGSAYKTLHLFVDEAPSITSNSYATAKLYNTFSFTLRAQGYPYPHFAASALPPGLTWADNGNGTATISGAPTLLAFGVHTVYFSATNALGTVNGMLMITSV
jgi:predicted Ser/Thr protein kinase